MTKHYSALTRFIPLLNKGRHGEWITDSEHEGTIDDPIPMPFVGYDRTAKEFIHEVYAFVNGEHDKSYSNYTSILEENGLEWSSDSLQSADISALDGKCIVAMILSVVRADRFCEGTYLDFLENGCIVKWLVRLQEIDNQYERSQWATPHLSSVSKRIKAMAFGAVDTVEKAAMGAKGVVDEATRKVSDYLDERKAQEQAAVQAEIDEGLAAINGTSAATLVSLLGNSPLELTIPLIGKIKGTFPIPQEQRLIWADAEFDLRPSGIAITDKGVFIRSNVGLFDDKRSDAPNGGKPVLYYYRWEDFEPSWCSDENKDNKSRTVDDKCSDVFIEACNTLSMRHEAELYQQFDLELQAEDGLPTERRGKASATAAASAINAETSVFGEMKAARNTPAGHGEMAEEAATIIDRIQGHSASVVGRDNAKNGADRMVDGVFVQTKYYKSATGSLEACFDPISHNYRYIDSSGNPMQLEVPKDQYDKVLQGFERKIKQGKVPGVSDPSEASKIVRKGKLTYQQAVNLTKPGTIESLAYDAATGAVVCTSAFGISFLSAAYLSYKRTRDLSASIQTGLTAGAQVFGLSFVQHIAVSQLSRTGLANVLMTPSQHVVGKLGSQASATIVNGLRALSGKSAIHGAAATKHLAKILRSNTVTTAATLVVFSIPETYNLASNKISGTQYAKNMASLTGSVAGGVGGTVAAGVAASKIAGAAGTVVAPGVGTAVGIAGGFVGGVAGGAAVNAVGGIIHESDIETGSRLFNAILTCLIGEYMLDEDEIDALLETIGAIKPDELKKLFGQVRTSRHQEQTIRDSLCPYFDSITINRKPFALPSAEDIAKALDDIATQEQETES